jgi:hypothetical protein
VAERFLERDRGRLLGIGDPDQIGGVGRLLEGVRDHDRDVLAVVADQIVLQHRHLMSDRRVDRRRRMGLLVGQLRRVPMGQHRQHARRPLGLRGVDLGDPALGDRALDDCAMSELRQLELGGVFRLARDLRRAVDPAQRLSDRRAHDVPPRTSSARRTARRKSSTLNAFIGSGLAPSIACAASS